MYILSDKFIGNIMNTKYSYLINDIFFYTDDEINYKTIRIDKNEIHKGVLKEFYTFVRVYKWMNRKIFSMIKDYIDKDNNVIYLKVNIDKFNNITNVHIVKPSAVKNKKVMKPVEIISPMKNNTLINGFTIDGIHYQFDDDLKGSKIVYIADICLPVFTKINNVVKFTLKNKMIFNYESKARLINDASDYQKMICV